MYTLRIKKKWTFKTNTIFLLVLLITLGCNTEKIGNTQISVQKPLEVSIPVYPNSEVIRVTNLNSEGEGSLKAALQTKGPRVIVFEVGGVINLDGNSLAILEPYAVIAGQTAPSPGVTIIRGAFQIRTHDVFVQHLSFRPGDIGAAVQSGWSPDGIDIFGEDCYRITIDHCSITWGIDENIGISGSATGGPLETAREVIVSNSIIAEGLRTSSHPKGDHSKGILVQYYSRDIEIFGNLFAHNEARNPIFPAFSTGIMINNIIYNPVDAGIELDYDQSLFEAINITPEGAQISIIGNVMHHGSDTPNTLPMIRKKGSVYISDNQMYLQNDVVTNMFISDNDNIQLLNNQPFFSATPIRTLMANELEEYIIQNVGPRPNDRNKIDQRIIFEFLNREGRIIDSQEEVGGYPNDTPTSRILDIPPIAELQSWLTQMSTELIR